METTVREQKLKNDLKNQMGNFITEMERMIVCQMKTLGSEIAEMKNASDGLVFRLHILRERISETKDRSLETSHFEHKEKK